MKIRWHATLAATLVRIGKLELALEHAAHARPLLLNNDDSLWEGRLEDVVGEAQTLRKDYEAAEACLLRARTALLRADSAEIDLVRVMNNLGRIYFERCQNVKAEECFRSAVTTTHSLGESRLEAIALSNLGSLFARLGDYGTALGSFLRALDLLRQSDDQNALGIALHNVATVHECLRDFEAAARFYKDAAEVESSAGARSIRPRALCGLSRALCTLDRATEALTIAEQALELQTTIGRENDRAHGLVARGRAHLRLGQDELAFADYLAARNVLTEGPDAELSTHTHLGLAVLFAQRGAADQSRKELELARPFAEQSGDPALLSVFWQQASETYESLGLIQEALDSLKRKGETEAEQIQERLEHRIASLKTRHQLDRALERETALEGELVELENQLRRSQKMEAIGRLAAGMAHDVNNLLVVIQGNAEILLADASETPGLPERIGEILAACDRGSELTSHLLAYCRMRPVAPQRIDIDEALEGWLENLRSAAGEGVRFKFTPNSSGVGVDADPSQIERVLLNLTNNAREAMPKGGRLTLSTSRVQIRNASDLSDGTYVRVTVTDTGTGIARKDLDMVFDPFFTTKRAGSGLGLSTALGIVRQSGGTIRISNRSAPDGRPEADGTSFEVLLPVAKGEAKVVPAPPAAAQALRGEPDTAESTPTHSSANESRAVKERGSHTVLVVEDESSVRRVVQATLETMVDTVLVAESAEEALSLVEEIDSIDLVLTDVLMPGMKGTELVDELERRGRIPKVVFTSGYPNVVGNTRAAARASFLLKPFSLKELRELIRTKLGENSETRPELSGQGQ